VAALKARGVATAVLTDSYVQAAEVARRRVGADHAMGLILVEDDGLLTGDVRPPSELPSDDFSCEYSYLCKEKGVKALADRYDVALEDTVMVGDSDPDACAMRVVGRSIAYDPLGSRVREHATHECKTKDLREVLEILEIVDEPIRS
jgi:phosphoserine phosphatase